MNNKNNTTRVNSPVAGRKTEAERFSDWLESQKKKPEFNVFKALVPESFAERLDEACAEDPENDCWTEKAPQSPEVAYFLQLIEETKEELFGGPKVMEFNEEIHGSRDANSNQYDGSYDELSSAGYKMQSYSTHVHEDMEYEYFAFKKERDDEFAETTGERDTTTQSSTYELNANWLKTQFATLAWAFKQLDEEVQDEVEKRYRKYMRYMQLRARDIDVELELPKVKVIRKKLTITNVPRNNRSYVLDYEEQDFFKPVFREQYAADPEEYGFEKPKAKAKAKPKAKKQARFTDWLEEVKKASKK